MAGRGRRWPTVPELLERAAPEQRAEIVRAAAQLGAARVVLPAPILPCSPSSNEVEKRATPVAGPVMNKTEARYEQRLRAEGHQPRFAALTLCIESPVKRRRYTPDFFLPALGELHEVKGAYVYPDAELKFEQAVQQWGDVYTFVWAQWQDGQWSVRRYERRNHAG